MESSRRAVEAYRRTRLIDGVTGDDDKVAPVYKLEEISAVLQSSSQAVVTEMVEYIFKKLDHKSPIVKQKTLRLIKFVVGKAGSEFKREIQRQSAAIRQLFHYKGQPDPLKGDSLNKAVRDTAHEAIAAMFAEEKNPAMDETRKRIQGFGSTNFDGRPPPQEKKTLLSEVVDLGANSIKQGLSIISNHYNQYNSNGMKNAGSNGSYEAPNFRRSLGDRDSYRESYRDNHEYTGRSSYAEPPRMSSDSEAFRVDEEEVQQREDGDMTFEEKLLSSVTPAGGVRLQPSREIIQSFLLEAQKANPDRLYSAFEQRMQAHSWQVRFKALCFLEAVIRQRDLRTFADVSARFEKDSSSISSCVESPQNSLRDKARKVLQMLSGDQAPQAKKGAPVELPDLMDTTDAVPAKADTDGLDLIAELCSTDGTPPPEAASENPFAGMSVHAPSQGESLLDVGAESGKTNGNSNSLFEGLSVSQEPGSQPTVALLADLLCGLSTGGEVASKSATQLASQLNGWQSNIAPAPSNLLSSQQQAQQQMMFACEPQQQIYEPQQQQQQYDSGILASLRVPQQTSFQGFNSVGQQQQQQHQTFSGFNMIARQGSFGSTGGLDGLDFSTNPYTSTAGVSARKEDTKAFDFISDHVAAARSVRK